MPEKPMIATQLKANKVQTVLGMAGNVPSPCISVCRMTEAGGLCEGCLRTLDEVAQWSRLSEAAKREIWARIGQRVARQRGTTP